MTTSLWIAAATPAAPPPSAAPSPWVPVATFGAAALVAFVACIVPSWAARTAAATAWRAALASQRLKAATDFMAAVDRFVSNTSDAGNKRAASRAAIPVHLTFFGEAVGKATNTITGAMFWAVHYRPGGPDPDSDMSLDQITLIYEAQERFVNAVRAELSEPPRVPWLWWRRREVAPVYEAASPELSIALEPVEHGVGAPPAPSSGKGTGPEGKSG
ncbi:hypothetical protein [Streptomyces sp. H34-S4]|uniref:hypothetical protein n=1 Tax=Streptomyces sp. H34-S4 TaxID=2996463 RepID=UPI00226EE306|nr:hypothetical protein [Streptomyces sp. H34-S4]MCY0935159.1 hypothetical protein [Streptomyces sp. H34-S4]